MRFSRFSSPLLLLLAGIAAAHPLDETLPGATIIFNPATTFLSTSPSNSSHPLPPSTIPSTSLDARLAALPSTATRSDLSAIFRRRDLYCETSGASPPIAFTHEAANQLIRTKAPRVVCLQRNPFGSRCTEHVSFETANIATCNGGKVQGVKCTTAAWAAKHIANWCQSKGKAGGYYEFWDVGVRVVVY